MTTTGMDAKDVKTHVSDLEKAMKDGGNASAILDILNSLKKNVVATEQLLRETKVGVMVNRVRSHEDAKVAQLSKEIVQKWKNDVKRPQTAAGRSAVLHASGSSASGLKSPTKSATPTPAVGGNQKHTGDLSKRNKDTDGVHWKVTGDDTRDRSVGLLYDGLAFNNDMPSSQLIARAIAVEKAIRAETKGVPADYKNKVRSIFLNLKNKQNASLRKRVSSGEISPERLATMTNEDMASEERKQEDEKLKNENMRVSMTAKPEKSVTDQLQCGKCKGRRVSYSQAQTRSADEPLTTFCECEICGNRWKFS